ncbi:MAG: hypothetical protein FWD73_07990 [Polyangiaceae bacterium]|nr:hypothetical protein [Polyangiaceae bacterium]
MKKASAFALGFLWRSRHVFQNVAMAAPLAMAVLGITACADESDPKTWIKRLDDPAQRVAAVRRLGQFFNDTMTAANNNRNDEKVKQLLDDSVEPLTKVYTSDSVDDRTRNDVIKLLADMGDARATLAFAKAFKDFEPGKTDDDVKFAAQGTTRIAQAGKLTDQPLIDALWDCFARFQPSKNNRSLNLVKDLEAAVMAVKHPSYGPKAVEKLSAPVTDPKDMAQSMDQIQFWQATSTRLIGELKFTPGIKPLVKVLLTPTKADLIFPVRLALSKMPKESEPILIAALKGTDPDFAALGQSYPNKGYIPLVAEPLAYISRPAGRNAILDALAAADNDTNRTVLAIDLTHFPSNPTSEKAYLDAYSKVDGNAAIPIMGGANGHAIMAQSAANFFNPSLTDWLLKETAAAKGEAAYAMPPAALQAAIKLMTNAQSKAVNDAVAKIPGQAIEKDMFKAASVVLDKCKQDANCYVSMLDTTVPSTPPSAKMGHVKAAWMAGIYGNEKTKQDLVSKVEKIRDRSVRLALIEAIDHLAPQGDGATADKLEKIAETDRTAGLDAATDEVYKVALKLRSRVP